jgi:hypothetical protein
VVVGRKRVVALTTSGNVISWGVPSAASCSSCAISSPPSTRDVPFPASRVYRICAGALHFGAIDAEQRLWTWGSGTFGQLGHGSRRDLEQPRLVESIGRVVDVALGSRHTVALSVEGDVFTWGWGAGGQLGHESPVMCELEARCVRRLGSWGTVTAVYAGPLYTAVLADGQLLVWGTVDVASSHDNGLLMHSLATPRVVATPEDIDDGNIDGDGDGGHCGGNGGGDGGGTGGGNGRGSKESSDVLALSCLETKMLVMQRTGALLYSFVSPDDPWQRIPIPRGKRPVAGALTPSEVVLLCRAVVKEEEEAEEQVQNDERVFGGVDNEPSWVEYGVEGRVVGEDGLSFDFDFDDLDHKVSHSDDSGEGTRARGGESMVAATTVAATTVVESGEGGDSEGLVLRDSTNAPTLRTTEDVSEGRKGREGREGASGQERVEHILAGMTARMLDARRTSFMEQCANLMENGSAVRKMHFTKSSFSKRWITLDSTRTKVGWVTGRQNRAPRKWLPLSDVVAVHYGPLSDVFQSGRSLKVRRRWRRAGGGTVCVRGNSGHAIGCCHGQLWSYSLFILVPPTVPPLFLTHTRIAHTHHTHTFDHPH